MFLLAPAARGQANPTSVTPTTPQDEHSSHKGASAQSPAPGPSESDSSAPAAPFALPNQPPTPGISGDWLGRRSKLVDEGLTVSAAIYYDLSKNFTGGVSTARYASREFFDLDVTYTTDQLLHWHGSTFFFNLLDHEGTNG